MSALDEKSYDKAVASRINKYIFQVNRNRVYDKSTLSVKLEQAWALNIEARKVDSDDTLNIGADADYYFAARRIVATDHGVFSKFRDGRVKEQPGSGVAAVDLILAPAAQLGYDLWKKSKAMRGHPEEARTDPDRPNSAPFRKTAYAWEWRGARQGFMERGQDIVKIFPCLLDG